LECRDILCGMEHFSALDQLPIIDFIAVAFVVGSWFLVGWRIEHPSPKRSSVTMLMAQFHRDWAKVFVERDPRIFDSQVLGILRQGTAFFASTSILVLGGLLALMGNADPLRGVVEQVGLVEMSVLIWQLKFALVAFFVTNAFLKFVWAHRVFGYGTVMMAAVPNDPNAPDAIDRAMQAAELNIRAVINFNRGLRALYYALGSLGWILGTPALFLTTLIVIWVLWSREFASVPRSILINGKE